uniref:Putative ovule protein n=1 Tax=Solanum chacoense TaxID=4108 RepID=A0A0V0I116_SOLCH
MSMLIWMCEHTRRDMIWGQGGCGNRGEQDEESEIEMVQLCEKVVHGCASCERLDVARVRRGRGRPKKNWGGD